MAEYPPLSFADVSSAFGRPLSDYDPAYSSTAISQATLFFKIATCLTALPEDPLAQELAKMAILQMAETLILAQPYAQMKAKPVSSETLGSYSYSKLSAQVMSAESTGVFWFDLAVERLGVCDSADGAFFYGGIEMMEYDGRFTQGQGGQGNIRYVPDSDLDTFRAWNTDPYGTADSQRDGV